MMMVMLLLLLFLFIYSFIYCFVLDRRAGVFNNTETSLSLKFCGRVNEPPGKPILLVNGALSMCRYSLSSSSSSSLSSCVL